MTISEWPEDCLSGELLSIPDGDQLVKSSKVVDESQVSNLVKVISSSVHSIHGLGSKSFRIMEDWSGEVSKTEEVTIVVVSSIQVVGGLTVESKEKLIDSVCDISFSKEPVLDIFSQRFDEVGKIEVSAIVGLESIGHSGVGIIVANHEGLAHVF